MSPASRESRTSGYKGKRGRQANSFPQVRARGQTTGVGRNFKRSALRSRKRIMREIEFRFIDSLIYAAGKIASVHRQQSASHEAGRVGGKKDRRPD